MKIQSVLKDWLNIKDVGVEWTSHVLAKDQQLTFRRDELLG